MTCDDNVELVMSLRTSTYQQQQVGNASVTTCLEKIWKCQGILWMLGILVEIWKMSENHRGEISLGKLPKNVLKNCVIHLVLYANFLCWLLLNVAYLCFSF